MNKTKLFTSLSFILIIAFFLFCLIILEYYLKTTSHKINKEAYIKETIRKQTIDRNLYQDAITEGYESIYYPILYEQNYLKLKKEINLDIIPINSKPYAKNYYCNEGYGLIKYTSDRFGFRNNDDIWKIDNTKNKILLVGDSFAHGACLKTESTIATFIEKTNYQIGGVGDEKRINNKVVFNVALGGNDPYIYASLIHLFSPIIKPDYIVVVFYVNDKTYKKNSIFLKNLQPNLHKNYFSNNYLSQKIKDTIDQSSLLLKKINLEKEKNLQPSLFAKIKILLNFNYTKDIIVNTYVKFSKTIPFSSRLTIDKAIENCKIYNCKPVIVYIPNSKYWRPDSGSDAFADSLNFYTIQNKINFIDMREYFSNFVEDKLYAKSGPHLSPFGSKLVANKIIEVIK
jgi:hypothetical protein